MKTERTLVLIKPDGLIKSLTGNIITALSETKLKIVGSKVVKVTKEFAEEHYSQLLSGLTKKFGEEKGKSIFESTLDYVQGKFHTDRVLALVYAGENAVEKVREIAGETHPERANPTSIRGKYGRIHSKTQVLENVMHCSDSVENAEKEIALWFKPGEVVDFKDRFRDKEIDTD